MRQRGLAPGERSIATVKDDSRRKLVPTIPYIVEHGTAGARTRRMDFATVEDDSGRKLVPNHTILC